MRAMGYVRVSDESQVDGYSPAAQERAIVEACSARGYELVAVHRDLGVSASSDTVAKRPAFARLLEAVDRRECDVVIVHELSRWARHVGVQVEAFARLTAAGVQFLSLAENIDPTTPEGEMIVTNLGGVNRFLARQLARHVEKGQRERVAQGGYIGGIPFGYATGGVVVPEHAEAVREAFVMRACGQTYRAIADHLNRAGFVTRMGNPFTTFAVKDLLACRFYLGLVSYRGEEFPAQHAAIVDRALFEQVQERRASRRPGVRGVGALLTGRIRCTHCRRAVWTDRTWKGQLLYREQHGLPCRTQGRSIVAADIDALVGTVFAAIRFAPEFLDVAVQEATRPAAGRSVEQIEDARRRLARAYGDGAYTRAEYEARRARLTAELEAAAGQSEPQLDAVVALSRDLGALWDAATVEERREILAHLVEEVHVDIEARRLGGIVATPAFDAIMQRAYRAAFDAPVRLARAFSGSGGDGGELTSRATESDFRGAARYWAITVAA